jgi:hypothetical protein
LISQILNKTPFISELYLNTVNILFHSKKPLLSFWEKINLTFQKINLYYLRTEHLWLDGFLFDFLQKKTADIWVRKFVIYTGFIFSERLVFDSVVKLYMDYFVWYTHKFSIFEVSNVFEMLTTVVYFLTTLLFSIVLIITLF